MTDKKYIIGVNNNLQREVELDLRNINYDKKHNATNSIYSFQGSTEEDETFYKALEDLMHTLEHSNPADYAIVCVANSINDTWTRNNHNKFGIKLTMEVTHD